MVNSQYSTIGHSSFKKILNDLSHTISRMKQLLLITFIFSFCLVSCTKKESGNSKEESVVAGKISGLSSFAGRDRIKLIWKQPPSSEGQVAKYRVFWNNNADSLEVAAPATGMVTAVINDLAESSYTFSVYSYDNKGDRSEKTSVNGHAYGSVYEATLANREIKDTVFNTITKAAVITWNTSDTTAVASEIQFNDSMEVLHIVVALTTTESTTLNGYKSGSVFAYRTLFLPESEAIDTFFTAYDSIKINLSTDGNDAYASMVTLEADGPGATYELIGSVLGGNSSRLVNESPDCSHPMGQQKRHIWEEFNGELNKQVFAFQLHVAPDGDLCEAIDRQRNEIKSFGPSPATVKAFNGDEMIFRWKFKLDAGFQPSSSFTHIHQVKAGDGTNDGSPLITITPRYGSPDKLEIIHTGDGSTTTLGKVKIVDLAPFKGTWIEAVEKIKFGTHGTYSLVLKRVSDGAELLSYSSTDMDLWRSGATFIRPKWGIYRSLNNKDRLRDEKVWFADFAIGKK